MFSLSEIFEKAQGGKAAANLADQFGLSTEQVNAAVKALIPSLSMALLSKLKDPSSLSGLASSLSDAQHTSTFSDANAASSPEAAAKGNDIIAKLFGSSHIVTQIAQQASGITGLRAEVLVQMLPVIVSVIAGGVATSLKNQGLGGVFSDILNGGGSSAAAASNGGFFGLLSKLFGGLFGGGAQPGPSGLDSLSKILQPGIGSSGIEAEVGKILASR
jgi:hypothetical protein